MIEAQRRGVQEVGRTKHNLCYNETAFVSYHLRESAILNHCRIRTLLDSTLMKNPCNLMKISFMISTVKLLSLPKSWVGQTCLLN